MFRSATQTIVILAIASGAAFTGNLSLLRAQEAPDGGATPEVSPELHQLLTDWARGSSNVKKLHGKHVRRAYDFTFKIEKISQGEFWYEAPDKGRIDMQPVKITPQMLAEREQPDAQVQRDTNGKAFELKSEDAQRWICDGQKVFDVDDERKEARIANLPPQIRGENIMNSPLPFLFGMPPEKAVQRFQLTIVQDYRPRYPAVRLKALPKFRKDAENWSEAEIILHTQQWLPSAVNLVNPAKTKHTRYTFSDFEVNKNGLLQIFGGSPWDPKLGKDYRIHMIQPGQQEADEGAPAPVAGEGPTVPKVIGLAHNVATEMLLKAGIPRENISKQNAGPAPKAQWQYLVRDQNPKPGQPLASGQKVVLLIFDKPVQNAKTGNPGSAQLVRQVGRSVVSAE